MAKFVEFYLLYTECPSVSPDVERILWHFPKYFWKFLWAEEMHHHRPVVHSCQIEHVHWCGHSRYQLRHFRRGKFCRIWWLHSPLPQTDRCCISVAAVRPSQRWSAAAHCRTHSWNILERHRSPQFSGRIVVAAPFTGEQFTQKLNVASCVVLVSVH